ncbi:MAG TPA: hypothetical protein DIW24_00490 [Bacteroidetes bacterium]|nr:hypothetical protein [Bacteroidota bacterium]
MLLYMGFIKRISAWWVITIFLGVVWAISAFLRPASVAVKQPTLQEALVVIQQDFEERILYMKAESQRAAIQPFVLRCLEQVTAGDHIEHLSPAQKEAIAWFSKRKHFDEKQMAIELYDVEYGLLAWNGVSLPIQESRRKEPFPTQETIGIYHAEQDGLLALEHWAPVYRRSAVVGGIRVVYLINVPVSAQGSSLPDFRLEDLWQKKIMRPVRVDWRPKRVHAANPTQGVGLLRAPNGVALGEVQVFALSDAERGDIEIVRIQNVALFWGILFLGWLVFGVLGITPYLEVRWGTGAWFWALGLGLCSIWVFRFVLLYWNIPERLLQDLTIGEQLFNPRFLASDLGWGLMRSIGDLTLTTLFAWFTAFLWSKRMYKVALKPRESAPKDTGYGQKVSFVLWWLLITLVVKVLWLGISVVVERAVNDSVLDYLAWTGLMPPTTIMLVYCSLLLLALTALLVLTVLIRLVDAKGQNLWPKSAFLWGIGTSFLGLALLESSIYLFALEVAQTTWPGEWILLGIAAFGCWLWRHEPGLPLRLLHLRSLLLLLLVGVLLTYPALYHALRMQLERQMALVADTFAQGEEERVLGALAQSISDTRRSNPIFNSSGNIVADSSLAAGILARFTEELNDLGQGDFETAIGFFDLEDTPLLLLGRGAVWDAQRSRLLQSGLSDFLALKDTYLSSGETDQLVQPVTRQQQNEQFQYEGLAPLRERGQAVGWLMLRAEQRIRYAGENSFVRTSVDVIQPDGWRRKLSVAEYQNGILLRGQGGPFTKTRLTDDIMRQFDQKDRYWGQEAVYDQIYNTFYQNPYIPGSRVFSNKVIAVRAPATNPYDHLYYLLRIIISGLWLLFPVFVIGLIYRFRKGFLPLPRRQFRDKVLNAFLVVGVVSVVTMGVLGQQVVTRENREALRENLERRLDRTAEAIRVQHTRNLPAWEILTGILGRNKLDSLATILSLDINVYRGSELVATTRPDLVRERLVPIRLPIEAYEQLYLQTLRNAYVESKGKADSYTIGYRALADENGVPRYSFSVLMLSEQEQVLEERARTTAYLFGALLLLLLVVMVTVTVLANALTRPLSGLRQGLQAVASGRFDAKIPVTSPDEVGELVETFNDMQQQLAESRQKLGLQERQLAWSEMARQVAHEIKNPLTPMKLSLQHLKRAQKTINMDDAEERIRFEGMFTRITATLDEQIDSLTNIANSFSTFARLPKRVLERLELNAAVEECISLMERSEGFLLVFEPASDDIWVMADREELRRIFLNLIKNALQAMSEGGTVTLNVGRCIKTQERPMAFCEVHDTGTGIPEELRDKIFQPNFSTKTSGMGLGLAIVRKSIEDLGGQINFTTMLGVGTTFRVELPLASA